MVSLKLLLQSKESARIVEVDDGEKERAFLVFHGAGGPNPRETATRGKKKTRLLIHSRMRVEFPFNQFVGHCGTEGPLPVELLLLGSRCPK